MENAVIREKGTTFRQIKVAAAAVPGYGHEKLGLPGQDKVCVKADSNITVIALADGAGSASKSDVGAALAVETVTDLLAESFNRLIRMEAIDVKQEIIDEITRKLIHQGDDNLKQYASTLLFVAVCDGRFLAGHLGDGVIGCLRGGNLAVLSQPETGEYTNSTYFTTSNQAIAHLRLYRGQLADIQGFILMSDGAAESLFLRRDKSLASAVGSIFQWLDTYPSEQVILALERNLREVIRERTADDCSLAVMLLRQTLTDELISASPEGLARIFGITSAKLASERLRAWQLHMTGLKMVEICKQMGKRRRSIKRHLLFMRRHIN